MSNREKRETVCFILKRPNVREKRKKWSLIKVTRTNGARVSENVKHPVLDTINKLQSQGVHTFEQLEKQAVDLRDRLSRKEKGMPEGIVFNAENYTILGTFKNPLPGTYWKEVYGKRTKLRDRSASYYDLRRSVEAIGKLSLVTATQEELQEAIDKHKFNSKKQRRTVDRIMSILRFIGREIELERDRLTREKVHYLTDKEFLTMVKFIEDERVKILAHMAFYTGMRFGELLAVEPESVFDQSISVNWQLDRHLKTVEPKSGTYRAYARPEASEWFKRWFDLSSETPFQLRKIKVHEIITYACVKAFPGKLDKYCVFHDLRHSHAIHLLLNHVPLSFVAKSLGNSQEVCERYYQGFVATDGVISAIDAIVKKL